MYQDHNFYQFITFVRKKIKVMECLVSTTGKSQIRYKKRLPIDTLSQGNVILENDPLHLSKKL